jgi:transcriptional regulator with XRE-family HTH domain
MTNPTPEAIRAKREAAALTQAEAAELVHLGSRMRWSEYERGAQAIDRARWELFLVKTDQHPEFRRRKA